MPHIFHVNKASGLPKLSQTYFIVLTDGVWWFCVLTGCSKHHWTCATDSDKPLLPPCFFCRFMRTEQMIPTYTQVAELRCITRRITIYQLLGETITIPLSENVQQHICLFINFLFAKELWQDNLFTFCFITDNLIRMTCRYT